MQQLELSLSDLHLPCVVLEPSGGSQTSVHCAVRDLETAVSDCSWDTNWEGWSENSRNKQHGFGKQRLSPGESLEGKEGKGRGGCYLLVTGNSFAFEDWRTNVQMAQSTTNSEQVGTENLSSQRTSFRSVNLPPDVLEWGVKPEVLSQLNIPLSYTVHTLITHLPLRCLWTWRL